MANDASSLKKAAVLTGLTMVIGGAEVSETKAAPVVQSASFSFSLPGGGPPQFNSSPFSPGFSGASPPPAGTTLTEVDVILDSTINFSGTGDATVTFPGGSFTTGNTTTAGAVNPFDGSATFVSTNPADLAILAMYSTSPGISLALTSGCELTPSCKWSSDSGETGEQPGLTLEYTYTTTATPVPGALPLFATGLGALGLLGWRRKRKAQAAI